MDNRHRSKTKRTFKVILLKRKEKSPLAPWKTLAVGQLGIASELPPIGRVSSLIIFPFL